MVITSKTPLKPPLNKQDGVKTEERRESVLRGLLEVRQSFCPSGFGRCQGGICCALNGGCCPGNICCGPRQPCCADGCCGVNHYCTTDPISGQPGCCPLGETCSGLSNTCSDDGFFPCPNDDFCCPSGNTCFRDSNGNAKCRASGSNPPATTRRTTTFRATTTKVTKSTFTTKPTPTISTKATPAISTKSTRLSSSEDSSFTSQTADFSPTVYPTPVPSSGSQNEVVGPTDSRILWVGTFWTLGTSSCNSTTQSKKTSVVGSFSLEADPGTSVYLTLSALNVEYEIKVNGSPKTYKQTTSLDDCKLTWSSGILTIKTEIIITVIGPVVFDKRRQLSDNWSFEFHNFLMTTSPAGSTNGTDSSSTSGFNPPMSAAMSLKDHSMLYAGLAMVLVTLLRSL
ncbi:hypothetical protein BDZ94DRAFT_231968 [Collybia nuda]|uniref:Uncharacterized protein n=1 Tax=Collybia nuda TaxID=64659 RepID=A0A9P5XXK1_9AGAR|nr:hypothetical protein BDZ94DRAFT_231968 [Collybia nuda]